MSSPLLKIFAFASIRRLFLKSVPVYPFPFSAGSGWKIRKWLTRYKFQVQISVPSFSSIQVDFLQSNQYLFNHFLIAGRVSRKMRIFRRAGRLFH